MAIKDRLLDILADGRFHSGQKLGQTLGVSRNAVWKHIQAMQQQRIIHAVRGRGYRLLAAHETLSATSVQALLCHDARHLLSNVDYFAELDSTQRMALAKARAGVDSGYCCLAGLQTAGRGRRGREWVSSPGGNIYMSLMWRFGIGPEQLAGLGLVAGVAVLRALHRQGADQVRLKWPNDLVVQQRKLAGVLLEMSGVAATETTVVIGVGINIRLAPDAAQSIDQPWAELVQVLDNVDPNRIAAGVLGELLLAMAEYQTQGLTPFLADWRQFDSLSGQHVTLSAAGQLIRGLACGVDDSGALLLERAGKISRHYAGDVSLRRHAAAPA